jgi:ABC-type cobalamin/Fe3+-siderophores transport system ATPase subunit
MNRNGYVCGRLKANRIFMYKSIMPIRIRQGFDLQKRWFPSQKLLIYTKEEWSVWSKLVQSLSVGQKCTALLSLVLLESQAPLLIYQPEDDLDNYFIFDHIVTTLMSAKEKRKFIITTHNANIPVSGDAELILVMQADDQKGWINADGIGSIDTDSIKQSVEKILEGGEVAFEMRKEKYGI